MKVHIRREFAAAITLAIFLAFIAVAAPVVLLDR